MRFQQQVLERVRALPGVEGAAYTSFAPLTFDGGSSVVFFEGRPRPEQAEILRHVAANRGVSAGYFEALGIPLVSGRLIDERDVSGAPATVVINETLARNEWPGQDPIGQRVQMGAGDGDWMTVVGVVRDVQEMGLDVPAEAQIYVPFHEVTTPFMWPRQLVVRTAGDRLSLAPAVRRAIWDVDPDQPVSSVRAMSEVLDAELGNRDTQLTLIGTFALLALVLAATGLYGVLSYTVSQSKGEIGLRMALGAQPKTVIAAVVREAVVVALVGIGLGLVAAVASTQAIAAFLYGVGPTDPTTAAAVAGVLLAVTVLAAFVPARRAAGVDPAVTLRADN